MKRVAKAILIAFVGFVLGMAVQAILSERTGANSNRFALEDSLREGLQAYQQRHGTYPDSLDDIEVSWIQTRERRKMLLLPFYYEKRGDSYVLWWPRDMDL